MDFILIDSYDLENSSIEYYDKDGVKHSSNIDPNALGIGLFSPDELWNNGSSYINYSGFDYEGNILKDQPAFSDFFNATDENDMYTRPIGAFSPIYMAGYIQDQFAFKDLIFNIGVRIDRYDANQQVLADQFVLYPRYTVSEKDALPFAFNPPDNIGDDYVIYVDQVDNPTEVVGYRDEYIWYNAEGVEIQDPSVLDVGYGISPALVDTDQDRVSEESFRDYDPQISVMPRISFSFPISDEALFFAHYDILTQRPTSNSYTSPATWYYFNFTGGQINNPNLLPTKTIDYELGFTDRKSVV